MNATAEQTAEAQQNAEQKQQNPGILSEANAGAPALNPHDVPEYAERVAAIKQAEAAAAAAGQPGPGGLTGVDTQGPAPIGAASGATAPAKPRRQDDGLHLLLAALIFSKSTVLHVKDAYQHAKNLIEHHEQELSKDSE